MVQQQLNSAESLQDAFLVFNELSENLTRSYLDLESQVARLTQELALARDERLETLIEKEKLANRLQRLLEALPGGVLVVDGLGFIIEYNPAAAGLLGEDLAGRNWLDVLQSAGLQNPDNPHQRQLLNGKTVSLSVNPLGGEPGQIVLLTDISEMRELQELVNQQKRLSAMGEMVASLAHQVRTPLSAALLYASHLGDGGLNDAKRERFSGKLIERLLHMERQVNDMLAFARMGKMNVEKIDASQLVKEALETVEATLSGRPIRFSFDVGASSNETAEIFGNRDALLGILLNLLTNAVEALNGSEGEICLSLEYPVPGWLRINVSDNGPGIPEDILGRIFEPFFTTRTSGTGLGLSIVDCVIRAHGGKVSCQSSAGTGTLFQLDLPLADQTISSKVLA